MPKGMHNPLPASLSSECKKAAQILDSFINGSWRGSPGREIPERVLRNAKGLAILTVTKAGFLGSLRMGSGIIIARLPDDTPPPLEANTDTDTNTNTNTNTNPETNPATLAATAITGGRWSPPSAISLAGLGFGGQVGFEITDFVFILNTTDSVEAFSRLGSLTLSGNFSIAFGPLGRNAEIAGGVSSSGGGKMMSFAKTKGLFGGVSVESGVVVERRWANRRFYGKGVNGEKILSGQVGVPEGEGGESVRGLMRVMEEVFGPSTEVAEDTGEAVQEAVQEPEGQGGMDVGVQRVETQTQTQSQSQSQQPQLHQEEGHPPPPSYPPPPLPNPAGGITSAPGTGTGTGSGPEPDPEFNQRPASREQPTLTASATESEAANANTNQPSRLQ
ncbi:hypothetical protein BJX70DRAFT_9504 [Aspergillus crustosus]